MALGVLQMSDAVFKGYGGSGYTHSGGGGLLQPNDFHGMAALLVETGKDDSKLADQDQRRRAALRRLMDPVHGNVLVQRTLTCLEREFNGTQPTIPEGCDTDSNGSDSEDEEHATLIKGKQFVGAAVSMLPPGEASAIVHDQAPTMGSKVTRGGNKTKRQVAEGSSSTHNPDVATFTTLFPTGNGDFAETDTGCNRRHYLQKMLGSVAPLYRRAEEVCTPSRHPCHHCPCHHLLPPPPRSSCGTTSSRVSSAHSMATPHAS